MQSSQFSDEEKAEGRSLAFATKIRLMLDEVYGRIIDRACNRTPPQIAGRISTRKKDDDVIKALTQLTGIIEDNTVGVLIDSSCRQPGVYRKWSEPIES